MGSGGMGRINRMYRAAGRLMLAAGMLLMAAGSAVAGWEAGTKLGFDSNVGRSIRGGKGARTFRLTRAHREPSGESRGDWVFSAFRGRGRLCKRHGSGLRGDHALPGAGLLPSRGLDDHRRSRSSRRKQSRTPTTPPWLSAARSSCGSGWEKKSIWRSITSTGTAGRHPIFSPTRNRRWELFWGEPGRLLFPVKSDTNFPGEIPSFPWGHRPRPPGVRADPEGG